MEDTPSYTINLNEIETNQIGISELLNFYAFAKKYRYTKVELNISPANSMDANLSALLLAISHKLKIENKVWVNVLLANNMNVFFRNGLISHLSGKGNDNKYGDDRFSTIPLTTFSSDDDENFCRYLKEDFFAHRGLDDLSSAVKNKFTHTL